MTRRAFSGAPPLWIWPLVLLAAWGALWLSVTLGQTERRWATTFHRQRIRQFVGRVATAQHKPALVVALGTSSLRNATFPAGTMERLYRRRFDGPQIRWLSFFQNGPDPLRLAPLFDEILRLSPHLLVFHTALGLPGPTSRVLTLESHRASRTLLAAGPGFFLQHPQGLLRRFFVDREGAAQFHRCDTRFDLRSRGKELLATLRRRHQRFGGFSRPVRRFLRRATAAGTSVVLLDLPLEAEAQRQLDDLQPGWIAALERERVAIPGARLLRPPMAMRSKKHCDIGHLNIIGRREVCSWLQRQIRLVFRRDRGW